MYVYVASAVGTTRAPRPEHVDQARQKLSLPYNDRVPGNFVHFVRCTTFDDHLTLVNHMPR